jgi:hypothetical protein
MIQQNDWHYARPLLAKKYLDLFEIRLTSARGLFSRRRMGKTEFLKKDFIPAAEKTGYIVVYFARSQFEVFRRGYFWGSVVFNAQHNSDSIIKR